MPCSSCCPPRVSASSASTATRRRSTAVPYYAKLPFQIEGGDALLLDPMLATGGSASHSITVCKEAGARDVRLLSLIAAPEGIARVHAEHPT